jgi:hypothetical protein
MRHAAEENVNEQRVTETMDSCFFRYTNVSISFMREKFIMFSSIFASSSTKASEDRISCRTRNEKGDDNIQVEVSFDVFDKLYSIAVTENASLQSVVSVPSVEPMNRRRNNNNKITMEHISPNYNINRDDILPIRLVDTLRPLSPLHERHYTNTSATTTMDQNIRGRSRGRESHSCPPPVHRGQENVQLVTSSFTNSNHQRINGNYRDNSCPPTHSRNNMSNDSTRFISQKPISASKTLSSLQQQQSLSIMKQSSNENHKKTKDLVSKSIMRNKKQQQRTSMFGSRRKTSIKVVPAP